MKIFAYAMREFDEKKFWDQLSREFQTEYGYTTEYPSLENASLAEGYDAVCVTPCDLNLRIIDKRPVSIAEIFYQNFPCNDRKLCMLPAHVHLICKIILQLRFPPYDTDLPVHRYTVFIADSLQYIRKRCIFLLDR